MPFPADASEIVFRGERVRSRADQIIVWVSLNHNLVTDPNPSAIPFPVILDTGHNHSFSISERQLNAWAGVSSGSLESRSSVRERGQRIALRLVNLWVHPNQRGMREQLAAVRPYRLKAKAGIAVYPGGDFPRLPILGPLRHSLYTVHIRARQLAQSRSGDVTASSRYSGEAKASRRRATTRGSLSVRDGPERRVHDRHSRGLGQRLEDEIEVQSRNVRDVGGGHLPGRQLQDHSRSPCCQSRPGRGTIR